MHQIFIFKTTEIYNKIKSILKSLKDNKIWLYPGRGKNPVEIISVEDITNNDFNLPYENLKIEEPNSGYKYIKITNLSQTILVTEFMTFNSNIKSLRDFFPECKSESELIFSKEESEIINSYNQTTGLPGMQTLAFKAGCRWIFSVKDNDFKEILEKVNNYPAGIKTSDGFGRLHAQALENTNANTVDENIEQQVNSYGTLDEILAYYILKSDTQNLNFKVRLGLLNNLYKVSTLWNSLNDASNSIVILINLPSVTDDEKKLFEKLNRKFVDDLKHIKIIIKFTDYFCKYWISKKIKGNSEVRINGFPEDLTISEITRQSDFSQNDLQLNNNISVNIEKSANDYSIIIKGTLKTISSLTISGSGDNFTTDMPFHRDGAGRICIPGSSLAGSLIAEAAKIDPLIFKSEKGKSVSQKGRNLNNEEIYIPSRWSVRTSYPAGEVKTWYRTGVSINPITDSSLDSALYDMEFVPPDTVFNFEVEINCRPSKKFDFGTDSEEIKYAAGLLGCVLTSWGNSGFIGGMNARGSGWVKLEKIKITAGQSALKNLSLENTKELSLENLAGLFTSKQSWFTKDFSFDFDIGKDTNNGDDTPWGIDTFSFGSHEIEKFKTENYSVNYPYSLPEYMFFYNSSSYSHIKLPPTDGNGRVLIPGSTLRGALRHAVSLVSTEQERLLIDRIFGKELNVTTTDSPDDGALLISDAYVDNPILALVNEHAEDEFTAGVYGRSLFKRIVILNGQISFKLRLESDKKDDFQKMYDLIKKASVLAQAGHIYMGNGHWRGYGWVKANALPEF